ncbi:MAG: FAD-dependent oxidoreductase [Candidatus Micrarchaeota archaeon]|nr:FAD-dependent oxidoreductase [Candidatus Micrarchaeota archaeon]
MLTLKFMPEDGQPCPFDPGMFMMISGLDGSGKRYTARAFSIASDPSTPGMEFMVIKNPTHGDHVGKSHFMDSNVGDEFMLKGPNGQFRFDPSTDKKVCFVAGGTGLAPFTSMLRHIKVTNSQNDVVLLYSTKFPTEIIWKDELNSYVNDLKIKLVITVTRPQPGDGWAGQTGHIDAEMIKKYSPDFIERGFYICGPLAFVKAVKDALTSLGVPANKVSADVWG